MAHQNHFILVRTPSIQFAYFLFDDQTVITCFPISDSSPISSPPSIITGVAHFLEKHTDLLSQHRKMVF